jgi:acyl-CoA synthetase (AMP-forming)/AMP-acid ligase II
MTYGQVIDSMQHSRMTRWIQAMYAVDPAAPELEFEQRWHSWQALADTARAIDLLLTERGLGQGKRIGVLLRNRPELIPTLLGLLETNRCLASINASAPDDKLADDVLNAAAPAIIATEADWARPGLHEAAFAIGAVGIALTGDATAPVRIVDGLDGDPARWTYADAPGVAIEMLSSGTTGTPKRIPLSFAKFEKALLGAASYEKGRGEDDAPRLRSGVQLVTAPLAHIAGMTAVMNNFLAGRKICLIEKFTVAGFRDAVVRHRPKVAGAPPSALRMLLDADIPKEDFASLLAYRTGTAPLDPDLADAFYARYGIPVLQNYGATEFAGGVAGWTIDDFRSSWTAKRGSVGRLNAGIEARVADPETGDILPHGTTGLLELRGGNIGDGSNWLRTTDLARVDPDRFVWIVGRNDGAIIRGGFKILPDDVIKAMEDHPAIREAAVTGLADRRLGQIPAGAYIVRAGATPPDEDELRSFLKERLMPYQVPVHLMRLDDMPRTPSMKVSQPGLRALFEPDA